MVPVDGSYGSRSTLLSMGGVQYVSQAMDQEFIKQGENIRIGHIFELVGCAISKKGRSAT